MARIFISYRRDDTKHISARIHDRLVREFGKNRVFYDVDKNIPAGSTWKEVLETRLSESDVLLVIIGDQWEPIINKRIDRDDWVRFEVEHGLNRDDMLVIPVLIEDTRVPRILPESIHLLINKQTFNLRHDPYFNTGMQQLSRDIRNWQRQQRSGFSRISISIVGIVLLIAVVFIAQLTGFFAVTGNEQNETEAVAFAIQSQTTIVDSTEEIITTDAPDSNVDPLSNAIARAWNFTGTVNNDWQVYTQMFSEHEMVIVPVGCFDMGSTNEQLNYAQQLCEASTSISICQSISFEREQPLDTICFDTPFWIDRYEVSNVQFGSTGNFTESGLPRESVTWTDADNYCQLRNGRLPSEAEWEYVARGIESLIYPWGNNFIASSLTYNRNASGMPSIVTSNDSGQSWVGAFNMSGNVWEWTNSRFFDYPYDANDGRENRESDLRILRGGSWNDGDSIVRPAYRGRALQDYQDQSTGFRCVLPIEAAQ